MLLLRGKAIAYSDGIKSITLGRRGTTPIDSISATNKIHSILTEHDSNCQFQQ